MSTSQKLVRYDLTITVKVLTVNRARRLRKIPYTKSKFHHSFEDLKDNKILVASFVCSVLLPLPSNGLEPSDNCLAMQSCSSSSSGVFGDKQKLVELVKFR